MSKSFVLYTGDESSHIGGSVFNCFLDKVSLPDETEKPILYNLIGHVYDPDFDFANFMMDKITPELQTVQITCVSGLSKPIVPKGKETLSSQIYTAHCLMEYILFDKLQRDYKKLLNIKYTCPSRLWWVFYLATQLQEEIKKDTLLWTLGPKVRDLLQVFVLGDEKAHLQDPNIAANLEAIITKLGTIFPYIRV